MNRACMLRNFLLSDSSISLFLHGLKSVVALAINWMVLAQFPSADYVTWAVSSSILVVATASDLGIGQYAATHFIHARSNRWPTIARESIAALVPLAVVAVVFVYLALGSQPAAYKAAMAAFIGLRILSIPFGAVLNAVNQFKLRKAIEVGVYLVSAGLIGWVAYAGKPVLWALLTLNASFVLGGFVTIKVAARYLDTRTLWASLPERANVTRVYRSSVPFMVNNLTGLLIYGGFIWVSSFLLSTEALAKLSVLHSFILINAYQAYDVILRARQADLANAVHDRRLFAVNFFAMLAIPLIALLAGDDLLGIITQKMSFTTTELVAFGSLVSIELGFLLLQSIVQVRPALVHYLNFYAAIKLGAQGAALGIYAISSYGSESTAIYVGTLATFSLLSYLVCRIHFSRITQAHLSNAS